MTCLKVPNLHRLKQRIVTVVLSMGLLASCNSDGGKPTSPASIQGSTTIVSQSGFAKHRSTEAVDAFKAAGLVAESPRPMTRVDYGLAPFAATEGTRFLIPSLGPDNGGRVMGFANADDLARTKAYYDDLGRGTAALFSHTFVKDNLLLQINGSLPDTQAAKYGDALSALK